MYRKAFSIFCGDVHLGRYSSILLKRNEVLIKTSYAYISVTDIALNNCELIAKNVKTLGSVAVGKVVDVGVDVDDVVPGSRAVVFAINNLHYMDYFGVAQDLVNSEKEYVKVVKLGEYEDKELLIIASLSVDMSILELLKGRDVMLIGEDISIITFAHYAQKYSCRIGIVPRYTIPLLNTVGTEHVSIYNSYKDFDVIVIATHDPLPICLSVKNFAKERGSKVIVYPHMQKNLAITCTKSKDIFIETISLGDIGVGVEVYNAYRSAISRMVKVIDVDNIPAKVKEPLIIRF